MFLMLLFWIPGVWLVVRIFRLSEKKGLSIFLLLALVLIEVTVGFVGPFWLNKEGSMYSPVLLYELGFRFGILAILSGLGLWGYSRIKKKLFIGIIPASLCISTGLTPILFITGSNRLAEIFNVTWTV